MSAAKLIDLASNKGYSISRYKKGHYQYSTNGYEWTSVFGGWNNFVKAVKELPKIVG